MTHAPRKLLKRAQRHAAILQGAATAFATKGYASTAMEEVAAASGITKEIVYRPRGCRAAHARGIRPGAAGVRVGRRHPLAARRRSGTA